MRILIFGAPGVGKGTQAKILSSKLGIPHISTGDLLREAITKKTEFGLKAQSFMDGGDLVPDEIIAGIIKERLQNSDCDKGFILDGIPRTIYQAELLDKIFVNLNCGKLYLVKIDAEDEVIVKRLSNRRLCSVCNNIVNLIDLDDTTKCPKCNSVDSFVKRMDDEAEVIQNRLSVYRQTTRPVMDYYVDKAEIVRIDGTQEIDKVNEDILSHVE